MDGGPGLAPGGVRLAPGARPRLATSLVFLANGAGMGAWAASIPGLQARLHLSGTALGGALLMLAAGAIASMPVAGWLGARRGGLILPVGLAFALLLLGPAAVDGYWALLPAVLVLGAANGALDVLMNAHAARVEAASGRAIMSSFHACWSLGALLGAGGGALAIRLGLSPLLPATALVAGLVVVAWRAGLADAEAEGASGGFALPGRAVLGIGALCFLAFMTEGAVADWSGVFMRGVGGASDALAATGYAGFSGAMVLARIGGDRVVRRLGPALALRMGAILAGTGFALAVLWPPGAVAGFTLVGLGVANMVPVLFSAAARAGDTASTGVAAASTLGYAGLLLGPPVVGALADLLGLRPALLLLVLSAAVLATARLRER